MTQNKIYGMYHWSMMQALYLAPYHPLHLPTPTWDPTHLHPNLIQMPFYPPLTPTRATPWIQPYSVPQPHSPLLEPLPPLLPSLPQSPPHLPNPAAQNNIFQQELATSVAYNRETRPIHAWLNGIRVFVQKEEYERKIHIRCPPNLIKASLRLRPTTYLEVGKYAILLLPTLRLCPRENTTTQGNTQSSQLLTPNNNNMNLIIWNCRWAQSVDFRRNFRSLLDYHHPSLVVLLETHYADHQHMKEEFSFTGMAEVAVIGQSGGIVILWNCNELTVGPVATTQ